MALFTNKQMTVGGVVLGVVVWYASRKVGDVAEDVIDAVNPLNQDNAAYKGANAVGKHLSGNKNFTIGGAAYDVVDSIRGLWGDSDADRLKEAERRARAQYEALAKFERTGGF